MDINKIIIIASISAVVISGSAVAAKYIDKNSDKNHVGEKSITDIQNDIENGEIINAQLKELEDKADTVELRNSLSEYYESTSNLNSNITSLRANLKADIDAIATLSEECLAQIEEVKNMKGSAEVRSIAIESLKSSDCFVNLEAAVNKANDDKSNLETALSDYNAQREREAELARKRQQEAAKASTSNTNTASSTVGSNNGGSNNGGSNKTGGGTTNRTTNTQNKQQTQTQTQTQTQPAPEPVQQQPASAEGYNRIEDR